MTDLPTQRDFEDFSAWTGRDVLAPAGERLGAVELIFLDEATNAPEWVLVRLEDADTASFVPLAGASVGDDSIRVEHDRERIAAAPRLEVEDTLTVAECRRLYDHYGLAYSQEESPTVLPEGAAPATEERPRLRKYIGAPVPAAAEETGPAEPTPPPIAPAPAPEARFQSPQEPEPPGGPLALLKRRPALPITLAAGIAALIGFLVVRKRR